MFREKANVSPRNSHDTIENSSQKLFCIAYILYLNLASPLDFERLYCIGYARSGIFRNEINVIKSCIRREGFLLQNLVCWLRSGLDYIADGSEVFPVHTKMIHRLWENPPSQQWEAETTQWRLTLILSQKSPDRA